MLLVKFLENSYQSADNVLTWLFQFCLPKWEAPVWHGCHLGFLPLMVETSVVSVSFPPSSTSHDCISSAIRNNCKKLVSNDKPVCARRQKTSGLIGWQSTNCHAQGQTTKLSYLPRGRSSPVPTTEAGSISALQVTPCPAGWAPHADPLGEGSFWDVIPPVVVRWSLLAEHQGTVDAWSLLQISRQGKTPLLLIPSQPAYHVFPFSCGAPDLTCGLGFHQLLVLLCPPQKQLGERCQIYKHNLPATCNLASAF